MKLSSILPRASILYCSLLLLTVLSCNKDEEEVFPITNDLRVLKVSLGSKTVSSGETDVSVIGEMAFVFSHSLNTTAFEQALSIAPAADLAVSYDDTKSFVTIGFSNNR
jgi:hypothetical protein